MYVRSSNILYDNLWSWKNLTDFFIHILKLSRRKFDICFYFLSAESIENTRLNIMSVFIKCKSHKSIKIWVKIFWSSILYVDLFTLFKIQKILLTRIVYDRGTEVYPWVTPDLVKYRADSKSLNLTNILDKKQKVQEDWKFKIQEEVKILLRLTQKCIIFDIIIQKWATSTWRTTSTLDIAESMVKRQDGKPYWLSHNNQIVKD